MIVIVRIDKLIENKNAGFPEPETLYFRGKEEIENACAFLWGRDINDYVVFRNGFRIEMDSDLYNLANKLKEYDKKN